MNQAPEDVSQLATEWLAISRPIEVFVVSRWEKRLPRLPRQTFFSWFRGCVRFSPVVPASWLGLDPNSPWVEANPWACQPTVVYLGPAITYETRKLAKRSATLCNDISQDDPIDRWFYLVTAFLFERDQLGVIITNNHRCGIPTQSFRPRFFTLPQAILEETTDDPIAKFILHIAKPPLAVPYDCYTLIEDFGKVSAEVCQTLVQKPEKIQDSIQGPKTRRGRPQLSPEQQDLYAAITEAYVEFQKENPQAGRKEFVAKTKKTLGDLFTPMFGEKYTARVVHRAVTYIRRRGGKA